MTTIAKATSRGQITLPIQWRKKFNTSNYTIVIKDNSLEIKPLIQEEEIIFNAKTDTNGKYIWQMILFKY
jgi:bifunctional DNA-binding transcriptional regulator/antitoxin component of YhaV-PrlF toxin-antitoxin module